MPSPGSKPYRLEVVGDVPLNYWRFGEAGITNGATFADVIGGANGAYGAHASSRAGALLTDGNGAAAGDGTAGFASVTLNYTAFSHLTVEFWLYWTAFGTNDDLAMEFGTTFVTINGFIMDPNSSTSTTSFVFGMGSSSPAVSWLDAFPRPTANAWHHYVLDMTRNGGSSVNVAYVDGVLQTLTTDTHGGTFAGTDFGSATLFLMSRAGSSLAAPSGSALDELAIYDGSQWGVTKRDLGAMARAHYQAGIAVSMPANVRTMLLGQQPPPARTCSDTAGGTDVVSRKFARTASDTAGGTDAAVRAAQTFARQGAGGGFTPFSLLKEDGFHLLTEASGRILFDGTNGTYFDTAGGTDVATRAFKKTAADTAGGTDAATRTLTQARGPWVHRRSVTTDPTQCGTADTTNFPVLVSGTFSYLATLANGGRVTNANGYDIAFFSDSALTAKLPWEMQSYDPTTGTIAAWVQVPTLSHTSPTVFYLAYGNASVTTDQSNAAGVWDANYLGVYHMGSASVLSVVDSTGKNPGTNHGATAVAGQIVGAANFVGASSQYISTPAIGYAFADNAAFTMEAWLKTTTDGQYLMGTDAGSGNHGVSFELGEDVSLHLGVTLFGPTGVRQSIGASTSANDGTFRQVAGLYDGSAAAAGIKTVMNGVIESMTTQLDTAPGALSNAEFDIGRLPSGFYATSVLDEVRISKVARSASYFLAGYNNQKTSSTFLTIGALSFNGDVAGGTDVAARTIPIARTASDTAGATDAAVRAAPSFPRTSSDTAGGTDTATRNAPLSRTASDTAGTTDVATRAFSFTRTASDTAGATDVAHVLAQPRIASDTAGGSDAATRSAPKSRTGTDTAGATDVASRTLAPARTASDSAGGTDAATRSAPRARTTSDTAGATDVATKGGTPSARTAADTAGGLDASPASIGTPTECYANSASYTGTTTFSPTANIVAGTVAILISNTNSSKQIVSIADSKGNTWTPDAFATDGSNLRATNTASCHVATTILTSDTITITWSDVASKRHDTWVYTVSGLAAGSVFDKTAAASASTSNPSSGATATLSQAVEIVWGTVLANGASPAAGSGFTAATTFLNGGSLLEYQIVSATTGIAATFSQGAIAWTCMVTTYLGGVGTGPTRLVALPRTTADTAGATDSARVAAQSRTAVDTAGGTDAATRLRTTARTGSDTAGGTDAATRIGVFARTTTDTAGASDTATRLRASSRTGSDTAGATDVAAPAGSPNARSAADTAGATDAATRIRTSARTAADTAGATDQTTGVPGTPIERYVHSFASLTSTTSTFNPTSSVTAGTTAFLMSAGNGNGKVMSSVTDSKGNVWTVDASENDGVRGVSIAHALVANAITPSDTITITWTQVNSSSTDVWLEEVSGILAASPFDQSAIATGSSTTPSAGPTGTLGQASEIAWGVISSNAAATTWVPAVGWSSPTTAVQDASRAVIYDIVAATTALTASGVFNSSGAWAALAATYRAAAATTAAIRLLALPRAGSDTAGASDVAHTARQPRTASDTAGGTDVAVKGGGGISKTASDTAGASDVATRHLSLARFGTNFSPLLAEDGSPLLAEDGTPLLSETSGVPDAVGVTDVATRLATLTRTSADAAGGTDSTHVGIQLRTASDTAGATDVATRAFHPSRTSADTAGGTDSATRIRTSARTSADTAGATDAATRAAVAFARTTSDMAGGTDGAVIGTGGQTRTAADTAGGTDVVVRGGVPFHKTAADTAGTTDAATRLLAAARIASDTAGATDAATRTRSTTRTASDNAGATDAAVRAINFARTGTDAGGGTDSSGNNDNSNDTAGGSDSAGRLVAFGRTAVNIAGGTDSAVRILSRHRICADTAGPADTASGHLNRYLLSGSDTAGGTDHATSGTIAAPGEPVRATVVVLGDLRAKASVLGDFTATVNTLEDCDA